MIVVNRPEIAVAGTARSYRSVGYLAISAVALGNAPTTPEVVAALRSRHDWPDPVVREHVAWALQRHRLL